MKLLIDVWNMCPRAFIQKEQDIIVPTDEASRIAYFETMNGDMPELGENVFDLLPEEVQEIIYALCDPINISGVRGTIEVPDEVIRH